MRKELGDRQGLAEGLETLADLLAAGGPPQPQSAARLLGAAHGLRLSIGAPVPAVDRKDYDSLVDRVRGMFNLAELGALTPGEVAFAAAWNAGEALAALPPEKFLEQALSPGSFGP
jgi:hypothetical protein